MKLAGLNRNAGIRVALLGALLLLGVIIYLSSKDQGGASSCPDLIMSYFAGLEKGDFNTIKRLVPEDYAASEIIQQRLTQFGGKTAHDLSIEYISNPITSSSMTAIISSTLRDQNGNSVQYHDRLEFQLMNGRWYLLLGLYRGVGAGKSSP